MLLFFLVCLVVLGLKQWRCLFLALRNLHHPCSQYNNEDDDDNYDDDGDDNDDGVDDDDDDDDDGDDDDDSHS